MTSIEVAFELSLIAELDASWTLVATPALEEETPRRHTVRGIEAVTLSLPTGTTWEISGELPGFWVKRQVLLVEPSEKGQQIRVQLWPQGTVTSSLVLDDTERKERKVPREIVLQTMSTPEVLRRAPSPPGVIACPVGPEGRWSCALPAGKLDLAILASGFIPVYHWGIEVPALGEKTLPPTTLRRGASVAGWVAVAGGKIDPETCVARLSPAASCNADLKEALLLSSTAVERKVGADGFLQFENLRPGNYTLEVRQPGYATAIVDLIQVVERRESFLAEPLLLAPPLTLRLEILPPLDLAGQPWIVRAYSSAGAASNAGRDVIVFQGPADAQGVLEIGGLASGDISVAVSDQTGNRVFQNLAAPWPVEVSLVRRIEIPQVRVTGLLSLGDAPLAASLFFGGRSGAERVRLESDEEGRFSGVLPRDGRWRVQIQAQEPPLDAMAEAAVRPGESGDAFIELQLPDNRLFGRILDLAGQPMGKALVTVEGQSIVLSQWKQADESGRFEFRGLPAGSIRLGGDTRESSCQAGPLMIAMSEDNEVGPVDLRCRKMRRITGTVLSSGGPVGGVTVTVRAFPPMRLGGQATTTSDGAFSLEVPADFDRALASLQAAGYGFQQREISLTEEPLFLALEEGVGELEVFVPPADYLQSQNLQFALFESGNEVPVHVLPRRFDSGSESEDGRIQLSQLAPGNYSACILEQPAISGSPLSMPDGQTCTAGRLEPGTQLTLYLHPGE